MRAEPPRTLAAALDFRLSEILKYDLFIGIAGGAGAGWLATSHPEKLKDILPLAAGLVGVVIGAVIAGVAILAAFLDQPFLRKLRAINKEPVRYMRPFLFTAVLGVMASLFLLVLVALPPKPQWLVASIAGLTGTAVVWTLASVIQDMKILVQFVGLQFDASEIPDDADLTNLATRRVTERGKASGAD